MSTCTALKTDRQVNYQNTKSLNSLHRNGVVDYIKNDPDALFTRVPIEADFLEVSSLAHRLLLFFIRNRRTFNPSIDFLAKRFRCSDRAIKDALDQLEGKKVIGKTRIAGKNNIYDIESPDAWDLGEFDRETLRPASNSVRKFSSSDAPGQESSVDAPSTSTVSSDLGRKLPPYNDYQIKNNDKKKKGKSKGGSSDPAHPPKWRVEETTRIALQGLAGREVCKNLIDKLENHWSRSDIIRVMEFWAESTDVLQEVYAATKKDCLLFKLKMEIKKPAYWARYFQALDSLPKPQKGGSCATDEGWWGNVLQDAPEECDGSFAEAVG